MLGGPGADDPEANRQMANLQVRSSFIQFFIAVGLINLGRSRDSFVDRSTRSCFSPLAPYALEALMGETVR